MTLMVNAKDAANLKNRPHLIEFRWDKMHLQEVLQIFFQIHTI